jgi:probable rRNA maturation factor
MPEVDILIEHAGWNALPDLEKRIREAVDTVLRAVAPERAADAELAILLADDAGVRVLNRTWRGQDKPTNVLSFPPAPMPGGLPDAALGDIALAYETCAAEAAAEGKAMADHMIHLVVHGALHLLGYDHETDEDAEAMEAREIALLASIGIPDPYAGAEGGAGE